jgi:hypothetical protein
VAKNYTKKTIYLAGPLADALRKRPDINFTRICQVALESAAGLSPAPEQPSPNMVNEIARFEGLIRNSQSAMEKIARIAASQAGMVVLTENDAEVYKKILDIGINQFIHRTKRDAVEAYKVELERQRQARRKARKSRAEKLAAPPEVARCVDCGEPSDIACSRCGSPLCWVCWTGTDLEGPANEMCQRCLRGDPPNIDGSKESSTNPA